jgi:RNA-binding protein
MKKTAKDRGLGTVLHIMDKKLIIRGSKPKTKRVLNSIAVTEDKRKIGKVYDLFGPVNHPYVAIKVFGGLKEAELKKLVHKKLYVL